MHGRASMTWGMEKIQDGFGPLKELTDDADFYFALAVSLNTQELLAKGTYDVKGKSKPPEHVVKILSALFRRYPTMTAVLNPIHVEHRDRLKPFCERWADRQPLPLLFHENFAAFNEVLAAFPASFRGALVTIKGGDTLSSVIRRVGSAKLLGLPVCLQNSSGMAFSDSAVLLEMAVGLGVEYIKIDGAGRPQISAVSGRYLELAEQHCNRSPVSSSVDETTAIL